MMIYCEGDESDEVEARKRAGLTKSVRVRKDDVPSSPLRPQFSFPFPSKIIRALHMSVYLWRISL